MLKDKYHKRIRHLPVREILRWSDEKLRLTEITLEVEINELKERLRKANLELRWLKGIEKLKHSGGRNGTK